MAREIITAIKADPENVKTFLKDHEYVIPDYQRPYSWGEEECNKLWEDLFEYAVEDTDSAYFLGNVVVYEEGKKRYVVDGQQRLITLSLLVKALFCYNNTYSVLEKMLYVTDYKRDEVPDHQNPEIRIKHKVLGEDEHNSLQKVLTTEDKKLSASNSGSNKSYYKNYISIKGKVEEKLNTFEGPEKSKKVEKLIRTIIENVILLPINCTDRERALIIFETINNRGMDLDDADIFKSILYNHSDSEKEKFIERWDELVKNTQNINNIKLQDIFTQYMHILRGQEGNINRLMGLRKFYDEEGGKRLKDWENVMESLEKLVASWAYLTDTNQNTKTDTIVLNFIIALKYHPNTWWQYPIMTYMHKVVELDKEDQSVTINKENLENLKTLLKNTARYCFAIWLKERSLLPMKSTIFKIVRDIAEKPDFNFERAYESDLKKINKEDLKNILSNKELGRGSKGVCLLVAINNEKQKKKIIPEPFHIEHILPTKWGLYKYSGWDDKQAKRCYNLVGNLVILERKFNIKASNRFFVDKQHQYRQSSIEEVLALTEINSWTPKEYEERLKKIIKSLLDFFDLSDWKD